MHCDHSCGYSIGLQAQQMYCGLHRLCGFVNRAAGVMLRKLNCMHYWAVSGQLQDVETAEISATTAENQFEHICAAGNACCSPLMLEVLLSNFEQPPS